VAIRGRGRRQPAAPLRSVIVAMELSYCVVNTNGRELLLACLEAVRRTHPAAVEHEILVLDNASDDGSAEAVAARFKAVRLIARERRAGAAENHSLLLREARGRFCLLLNEDSELLGGAAEALLAALRADPRAAVAGAQLLDPGGAPLPCAWRFPGPGTALAQALFLHRRLVTQSQRPGQGGRPREVGWVQSCAMLVRRRAAEEVGYLDPDFFVYSEEVDFQRRLRDAGWHALHVPTARAIHHEQLASDRSGRARRIVQFHRGRETYMRKHHSPLSVAVTRLLWAWSYVPRALAALVLPGQDARRYWLHARQALRPTRGEGMREAAEAYNLRLAASRAGAAPPDQVPGRSSSRATAS
jgi:N-acetylglucosaminyl-diphospho-decaprenol L-rhamnosyltransferase